MQWRILMIVGLMGVIYAKADAPPSVPPYESCISAPACPIDELGFAKLQSLGIHPTYLCSDAVFIRRVYLDTIGTLPTAQEAANFIDDDDLKHKRHALINRLLQRDEFADYWAMKWGDLLRIKAEFPVNLWPNAAQAYHHWVRASIAENKPYDQFVRELLTSSGSNVREPAVNFYRAIQNRTPIGISSAVALAFMGSRTDSWKQWQIDGMLPFFSQIGYKPTREWKEEIVFWDPLQSAPPAPGAAAPTTAPVTAPLNAVFPDGRKAKLSLEHDPRDAFANWLISQDNPWFAKAIVNRVWSWVMGRGIIHEADDIRGDNPPANPELLAYLEHELVASHYDLRHIYRLILNSEMYQFSSVPRYNGSQAEANFASYPLRRLDAEVLIDALNKITGTADLYTSPIPEPFTYIPEDHPAIALPDGSITSPFLALFGRSARATGMENERSNKVVSAQWLHLLNSSHIQKKIDTGPKLKAIFESGKKQEQIIADLYLTILSRYPTPDEVKLAKAYGPAPVATKSKKAIATKRHEDWADIAWALINSEEFLYRH